MTWPSGGRIKPGPAGWEVLACPGPGLHLQAHLFKGPSVPKAARALLCIWRNVCCRRGLRSGIRFCKVKAKCIACSIHDQKSSWLLNQRGYLTLESAKPEIEGCSVSEERKYHRCLVLLQLPVLGGGTCMTRCFFKNFLRKEEKKVFSCLKKE